jgi:hypothetical protein
MLATSRLSSHYATRTLRFIRFLRPWVEPYTTATMESERGCTTSRRRGASYASIPRRSSIWGTIQLAFHVAKARGKQSGADVAMPAAQVAKWRNDLLIYYKGYVDRGDALRELNVSERELEPIAP